jgi:hypothetical protein
VYSEGGAKDQPQASRPACVSGWPDVDLAEQDVRDSKGRRITEDYARRAAEHEPATVHRGRQSLTGGATHPPRVSYRVPGDLREAAERAAMREGRTVSELARHAF